MRHRRRIGHRWWLGVLGCAGITATASEPSASLWQAETAADGTLYSDQVARRTGDLITILVKETTAVSDKNKTKTDRKQSIDAGLSLLPGTSALPAAEGQSTIGRLPGLKADAQDAFNGEGNYEHQGEVRTTITARVTEVLDNGNLLVEGRREVTVNEDTKLIRITGIIRTADIRSDNTVLSEKLHGFQVAIEGEGPLTQANQKGWLTRIWDTVRPW
jgi:flagellar L-ring protein precursor FlgH